MIDKNSRITVISGAGFSQASGIPIFRGKDGLWKNYDPSELATPHAFAKDPKLVWEWYRWRLNIILNADPNLAHVKLAEVELKGFDIAILTQNVDDLHERAGSQNVTHLHGEIRLARCFSCRTKFIWTVELLETVDDIPKCSACESICRPDVVWFGESLDSNIIQNCIDQLSITDMLIVAGTSGVVYPAAEFPFLAKRQNSQVTIYEFNLDYTPISNIATETILGPVEETIPEFFNTIYQK
ncbi:MAG: NAD-dependent deacylase [Candidatus Heimdallarchaeota archaeon]|nr:MAG: NAD-dependent deacylase [Candidatus Heimdallarchaeota archaeon]